MACPEDVECNVEYDNVDGISLTLDIYVPDGELDYPAVLLIHGGGWDSGHKRNDYMLARADDLRDAGLVVFSVDYRLTCAVDVAKPLCRGYGHHPTTPMAASEAMDDVQEAVLWVRDNAEAWQVDTTRGIGALGVSAGGLLAVDLSLKGNEGGARVDAAVSWSGAMHLEHAEHNDREALAGCEYDALDATCKGAWDAYSPYHSCCNTGNTTAASPILLFNSNDGFIDDAEADLMYDLASDTEEIPVTKVILNSAGHAYYDDEVVNTGSPDFDRIDSDNYPVPPGDPVIDDKEVQDATADFFLAYL